MRPSQLPFFALLLSSACGGAVREPVEPAAVAAAPAPAPVAPTDFAPAPRDDGRLPPGAHPTRYRLELALDPRKQTFLGRTHIDVNIDTPTRAIVLHSKGLKISHAVLRRGNVDVVATTQTRVAAGSKQEPVELILQFAELQAAGLVELILEYEAPLVSGLRGTYRVDEKGEAYAFTQFEPNDASRAFPCFDEPGFKTPFEIAISVPKGNLAVANTQEVRRYEDASGRFITYQFAPSPPLPTYLVAFAVGPFDVLEGPTEPVPIRVITTRGKLSLGKAALSTAHEQLALLAKYFDRSYPYSKLDLIGVPNFEWGAMENAGLITFREELLLADPAHTSVRSYRHVAGTMAHELSHQWFGNLVTMQWWDDLWLNEAFASWISNKIVDQWKPGFQAQLSSLGDRADIMAQDSLDTARKIRSPVRDTNALLEAADGMVYVKGPEVLGMIESWVGAERFQAGMRHYVKKHAFGNVTSADLYAVLAQESGGLQVSKVMDSFTDQSGVPLVSATLSCPAAGGAAPGPVVVKLSQREYRTLERTGQSTKTWSIPVCVSYESGAGKVEKQCTLLDSSAAELVLPMARPNACPAFIYPNADERGYYFTTLDSATGAKLRGAAIQKLSESERFGLVASSWAAVWAGELPVSEYLKLLSSFKAETSRLVWLRIIDSLNEVDETVISAASRPAFEKFVRELLAPASWRLGWKSRAGEADEQRMLRGNVLYTLGDLGADRGVIEQAKRVAEEWFAAPGKGDQDVARAAFGLVTKQGDVALFERLVKVLKEAETPEIRVAVLRALTGFEDPRLAERALNLTLDGTVRAQDFYRLFGPSSAHRPTTELAYTWLTQHFDELVKILPPLMVTGSARVAGEFCTPERIREAEAFFTTRLKDLEGTTKELKYGVESGMRCVALANKERARTEQWLLGAPAQR